MTEMCWCRHQEANHTARGCNSCRGSQTQLLDWRHLYRCINELRPIRLPALPRGAQ